MGSVLRNGCFPIVTYAVQSSGPVLSGLMLDNGPALLASFLDQAGYKPVIFDYNNIKTIETISKNGKEGFLRGVIGELDEYVKSNDVRIVGFKLYTNGFADSARIAGVLKERNPGLVVIAGGPQVDWYGETIWDYTDRLGVNAFDILSPGYIDGNIVKVADHFYRDGAGLSNIPNLIYRENGRVGRTGRMDGDINELVFPLFDEEVHPDISDKIMIPVHEDSRSCSRLVLKKVPCYFCIHTKIGGRYQERDPEKLVDEMEHLKKHGFRVSRLSGPSPSTEYINRLVGMMPDGCMISTFGGPGGKYDYSRISGKVLSVFDGLESGDGRILMDLLGKTRNAGEYLSGIMNRVKGLRKEGIATVTSLIVPAADETDDSMKRTQDLMYEMDPDFAPVLPLGPMADTPLARSAREGKIEGMKVDPDYKERMMAMDVDLLQPPNMWPTPPWQLRVNGKWIENPFMISQQFSAKLMERGIYPLSDEIVLMSYLYHGGLPEDQDIRRKQCLEFMASAREDIGKGNIGGLREKVDRINKNQLGGTV